MICFKEVLDELRVLRVVLQQQDPERGLDLDCFMLPAGGLRDHLAFSSHARFAQRALHRGHEPRHSGLQNIVGRTDLERFNRHFLAERARNDDERQIGPGA